MPPRARKAKAAAPKEAPTLEEIFASEIKMRRAAVQAAMRTLTAYTRRITSAAHPAVAGASERRKKVELQLMADNTQSMTEELQKAVMRLNHAHLHLVAALWSAQDRERDWRFHEQADGRSGFISLPKPAQDERKSIVRARSATVSVMPAAM